LRIKARLLMRCVIVLQIQQCHLLRYSSIPEVIELMGDNNDDRFNSDTPIILVYPMEEEDMVSLASFLRLNNLFFPIIIIILSL
jgi:hypothetical protein